MSDKVLVYNHTFQAAVVATASGTAMSVGGLPAVAVQITGITSATITFEGTLDGTNWVAVQASNLGDGTVGTTASANGLYLIPTTGLDELRCRISTYVSGTITTIGKGVLSTTGMSLADVDIEVGEILTVKIDQTTPGTTDSVSVATSQGAGAAIGATSGAAVITDATGTIQQYLRGLVKLAITAGGFLVRATVASGGVASGAVASGAVAAGAIVDGADVTQGTTTDAAVVTDATGTVQQYLRGLVKLVAAIITVKIDQTTPGSTNAVYVTSIPDPAILTFGALTAAAMGNASPASIVAANASRRGLVITNISDTIGYVSIGDGTGLTVTNYLFRIGTGETIELSPPISQQAIAAICGSATKNVAYQEAT